VVPVRAESDRRSFLRTWRARPKKSEALIVAIVFLAFAAACSISRTQAPGSEAVAGDLATGTAIVARKYTEAAELTRNPITPLPTETGPVPTMPWTPSPGEITAKDSGKSVDIWITVRVSVVLDEAQYPRENLVVECVPEDAIGRISNIPVVPANFYVVRYEGVKLGGCVIRNGPFQVVINILNPP
jgi:hypothetical protein